MSFFYLLTRLAGGTSAQLTTILYKKEASIPGTVYLIRTYLNIKIIPPPPLAGDDDLEVVGSATHDHRDVGGRITPGVVTEDATAGD
jgi:hypothetical protein